MSSSAHALGRSVPRLEDAPLLKGHGQFAADIAFPHQLHMRIVRSPYAHAELRSVDVGAALASPGVAAVWTGEAALKLKEVLEKAESYPFCHKYRYWPGPNSNTFAAWVLRRAGIGHALSPMALGKRYPAA